MAAHNVARSLAEVLGRVAAASARAGRSTPARLVAVSKTKPASDVLTAYEAGHRVFGENYAQELLEKAPQLPVDIQWHFVGHLQSNKAKALLEAVPNLAMIESVDSAKLATVLDKAVAKAARPPLRVLVQVNTSGEESKYGVEPSEAAALVKHVATQCPSLRFAGLMTIGLADYTSRPEDFATLRRLRDEICGSLDIPPSECELSMGMSGDFESAIAMGATSVRVGSSIFGARAYPPQTAGPAGSAGQPHHPPAAFVGLSPA